MLLPLRPAAEAFASSQLHNHQRLLDRPTCCLSIARRSFGCIRCIHERVKRRRQIRSDAYLLHHDGP